MQKNWLLAGVAAGVMSLALGGAQAQDMPDLSGQTLSIAGPWVTPDEEHFRAMVAPFVEATNVTPGDRSVIDEVRISSGFNSSDPSGMKATPKCSGAPTRKLAHRAGKP